MYHELLAVLRSYWIFSVALSLWILSYLLKRSFLGYGPSSGIWTKLRCRLKLSRYPVVNPVWDAAAKEKYRKSFASVIAEGCEKFGERPFRINGFTGQVLVLHPRYIEEYKQRWDLDMSATTTVDFFPQFRGFEMFKSSIAPHDKVLIDSVKQGLNPNLGTAVRQLVEETPKAVTKVFGTPTEWTEAAFSPKILQCIAQLSGHVFLGDAKLDYPAWYKLTSEFVINASRVVVLLREKHPLLRPILHWFLPECREIRRQSLEARRMIEPAVRKRLEQLERPDNAAETSSMISIDWFAATAKARLGSLRNFDFVSAEFTLAIASIRTVSGHAFAGLMRLAEHPEYIQLIRDEIIQVLQSASKLDKSCLFRMRLLDSFLKESARMDCFPSTLRRVALRDVQFSDGTLLPQGAYCMIAPAPMKDSSFYTPDALAFDGSRYVKLRQAALEKGSTGEQYQYCSVSNHDTIFGLGVHVCPARFFATFQVKLLVSYMVLHYDMRLPAEDTGKPLIKTAGYERSMDHNRSLIFTSRQSEVDWQKLVEHGDF